MARFVKTLILILVVVVGCWLIFNRDRINNARDLVSLAAEEFSSLKSFKIPTQQASSQVGRLPNPVFVRTPNSIRVATFKLNRETSAAQKPDALRLMTEISRQFDIVAFQGVTAQNPEWLGNLALSLQQTTGSEYKFFTSQIRNGAQYATVYNTSQVTLDDSHFYTVNDPDDLFQHPALVGWFRVVGPEPEKAFTFSLANIELDFQRSGQELQHLGGLYRAIRQDGRGEDDIIIAGNFQTGEIGLGSVKERVGLQSVASSMPTNMMRTAQFDNILFSPVATIEFSGSTSVFDFMQHYNLFLKDSLAISQNLPVWAEFSTTEGLAPGRVASETSSQRK